MAVKDSVLNFVIKAKNLAGDVVSKFRKDVETLDTTSADASKSVDALGTAADNLGKEASSASSGTSKLNSALDGVSENASDAANALKNADESIDGITAAANQSATAADKAGAAATKLAQRYDAAGKPIETARQELKSTNTELEKTEGSSAKAGVGIGTLVKRLLGLAAAVVGVRTITSAFKSMFDTGDKFERLSLQMQQTMGSLAAGEQATAWVKDFAKNTPLQLQEVTDTFLRLKNFGLDPQAGAMQAIVDQAAKLGKGYEAVEGISLALGQAWAKQKLQGEEIMQLVERGVPVWDLLAKVTGKNTAELQKMSEAGLLGRDTIKALIDEMGAQSAGAAAQNMSLLSGYISNLTDEWQLFLNMIAESGALDYAKDQLRQLIDYIQELKANGELQQWAQRISDGFIALAEATKAVVFGIKDNIGAITLLAKAYATVKLIEFAGDAKNLASAMGILASRKKAATDQAALLATAMRAIPWIFVLDGAAKAIAAYNDLREAKAKLAASQAAENKIQSEATQRINEFNQQTGLAVKSLDEIIAAQNAGAVAIDAYTGKWRLATQQITAAEQAERASIDAMKAAQQERQNYLAQVDTLLAKFSQIKTAGGDVSEAIAAIGAEALSGEDGIQSLATAIQNIAFEGAATKDQLQDGLAEFLKDLSSEQYTKFGTEIDAALKVIATGSGNATASLGAMKTLIDADMRAAAQRLGVDVGEALTGIDESSKSAIAGLQELGEKLKTSGVEGQAADAIIKAGLLKTLKELDTKQEIDATIVALKEMGAAGQISDQQLQSLLATLQQQKATLQQSSDAQKNLANANTQAAGTWALVGDSAAGATQEMELAGSVGKALADIYAEIRAEVDKLGPAASAAFDKLQGRETAVPQLTGDFAELKRTIAETDAQIDQFGRLVGEADFTNFNKFLREAARDAAIVKKEYAEQKLAIERLAQGYEDGTISARSFVNAARGASSSTSLLNQADLSALKNQIKSAQAQMESFRDSTLSTLNSLKSELADLQGNADRVAQLAYESRIADLNTKLDDAKRSGDRESITAAQEALRVAKEIYEIKKRQIAEDKRASAADKETDFLRQQKEAAKAKAETQSPTNTANPQQPNNSNSAPTQRIQLALPNGGTANLTGSADDVNRLLEFLNEAGLRSLQ